MTECEVNNAAVDSVVNTKYKDGVNRNARLIVKNISFKATEKLFREHFSQYGTVEEAKLLKTGDGRLVGSGFIHYTHVPMAQEALLATNKKPFLGRPIFVSWAIPKHKYVKNEEEKNKLKNNSIDGEHIEVKTEEYSEDTLKNPPDEEDKKNKARMNRNARLIVRNISFKATEESLREHFEPYGIVQEVNLLKKPDGKLVGCAFVHFKNVPMASKALTNTNLKPFLGRPISVDWAVAKDKYMQHKVNQQIEMEDEVKKEESDTDDSDDDKPTPINLSNEPLKDENKSESEDEDSSDEEDSDENESGDAEDDSDDSEEEQDDDGEDEDNDLNNDDNGKKLDNEKLQGKHERVKLNDAEDGCTVFVTNIPFSVDNEQLKMFAEKIGPVKYALICIDKLTEHSKGTGFVKFVNNEDANNMLALPAQELKLEGQTMQVKPALKKENLQKGDKKQPKDNRNLYLVKEGVIVAGTKAAEGVSASDMAKRLALERTKTQALRNLNRFVSRYRLVVSNLPPNCNDARLRSICERMAPHNATITEARVMRDLRAPVGNDGKHPSKGFGFVMFMRHEDALTCLRKLNNNPDIFDRNNRPIVSFSIEDRAALNARKKRLEKSIANNPLANKSEENEQQNNKNKNMKNKNRKRKINAPDESYMKKRRFEKSSPRNGESGKFVKRSKDGPMAAKPGAFVKMPKADDIREFTGLTAKEGSQHKMRSNEKLRKQAELHKQNVKMEKKKSKRSMKLKMAARERVKQPKQKINKNKAVKRNKHKNRRRIDIR